MASDREAARGIIQHADQADALGVDAWLASQVFDHSEHVGGEQVEHFDAVGGGDVAEAASGLTDAALVVAEDAHTDRSISVNDSGEVLPGSSSGAVDHDEHGMWPGAWREFEFGSEGDVAAGNGDTVAHAGLDRPASTPQEDQAENQPQPHNPPWKTDCASPRFAAETTTAACAPRTNRSPWPNTTV